MTDEAKKAKDVQNPKIAPEVLLRGGVIKDDAQQADWRTTQRTHLLGQDESATDMFYKPGDTKEAAQKFELIDSSSHVEKIALRDDYLNRYEPKPQQPRDGQTITLQEALKDFKTPFMDAYEQSKRLQEGEPGKSKTLENIVERLKACPWAGQIKIRFNSRADNTDYDDLHSTITIRPQDTPEKQIENFAHEGFHATHQFLSKLYDHGIVGKSDFVNIWLDGEVKSMLTEIKVHQELNHKEGGPPAFSFNRTDNGKRDHIIISDYVAKHGEQGLQEFLRTAQPSNPNSEPYGDHYAVSYDSYCLNFQKNKPLADKFIESWVRSKHERSDI